MALAPNFACLLVGRLVVGLGVGVASMIVPVFVSKSKKKREREKVVTQEINLLIKLLS